LLSKADAMDYGRCNGAAVKNGISEVEER